MKNNEIQRALKLLSQPGIGMLIKDILISADNLLTDEVVGEGTEIEYAIIAKELLQQLRGKYKKQLIGDQVIRQIDLEDVINEIRGKEQYGK